MRSGLRVTFLLVWAVSSIMAQDISRFIVVDQFGYRPDSRKVAVIRDPQLGFDADESFAPGSWYALVDARTGELVFRKQIESWEGGATDPSSGDRAWSLISLLSCPGNWFR